MYYDKAIVFNPRFETMTPMLEPGNLALVSTGQIDSLQFTHAFVATAPVEKKLATHYGASVILPLFDKHQSKGTLLDDEPLTSNLSRTGRQLQVALEALFPKSEQKEGLIAGYIYSILYSDSYRRQYASTLKVQFPRIPHPLHSELTMRLVEFGSHLIEVHLLRAPSIAQAPSRFVGSERSVSIARAAFSQERIYPGTAPGCYFDQVRKDVWEFTIGGYQPAQKWLKDRKGRTLTDADIRHYEQMLYAIEETIRIMAEIDEVIEAHGGWPGAFQQLTDEGAP
jgi:hypothetical protein